MKINFSISIFILIFILLISGCSSSKKEYQSISTFSIYSPENNGINESEIKIQEDYSDKIMEVYASKEIREYISEYYTNLYGYEKRDINRKVKSIDNKNTIYQIDFDCDSLEEDDCILASAKFNSQVLSQLEISEKLYIDLINTVYQNKEKKN